METVKFLSLLLALFLVQCGKNTNTPAIPLIFFNPPSVPQIVGVIPIYDYPVESSMVATGQADKIPFKPQFVLKYYVTNTEQNFVGYNLSITSATPSLYDTQLGASIYTENGIVPSFPHLAIEASTEATNLKRRKIANRIPPPGLIPFQHCEVYTFTLRAVFSNGVISNPSFSVSQCASVFPSKCSEGTSCNPTYCATSTCSDAEKVACKVGTLCNPCLYPSLESGGCECPSGVSPPGCNP
ncbi:MAG: hypothetical protein H7A24_10310 [Leptospiraceae bacterium]|nr:hypothetical protein [Leptospiraceae bacterium]MCP5512263.1 hypothetical protein [Leptospiraceae bacterium]